MAAGVITVNRDTKPGLWPVMLGMGLVFSNMIKTMFGKELATIQFPEQKRPTSSRYRGIHVLTQREEVGRFCSGDRKSTRLNSSHANISYAVFCLKKKKQSRTQSRQANLHFPRT